MSKQPPKRRNKGRMPINSDHMTKVDPLTDNQERVFKAWDEGKHMFIYGCAGTGKTFCVLYKALQDVLKETPAYDAVYLVRSLVPSREIGFLPGDHDDKSTLYQVPYKQMVKRMFEMGNDNEFEMLYAGLKAQDTIKFWSTSFLRGVTLDNSVIIIDEMQNLNFHELDSIITRVGENSRIIFCGDVEQSDLKKDNERNGILDFMRILERLQKDTGEFELIEMTVDDIVRSGLVRNYLLAKRATPLG
jgi:predicted ribonuclease YlaK